MTLEPQSHQQIAFLYKADLRLDFIIFWFYTLRCAVVVVEGAVATPFSGTTTVLGLGLALNLIGLGLLFWLSVALAVYAFPFFVAVSAASMALDHGGGISAALTVAIVSAALTLAIAQFAHSMTRLSTVRGVIGAVFAIPAGIAGFHVTLALSQISVSSPFWCEAFACVGAIFIAGKAWMHITSLSGQVASRPGRPILPQPALTDAAPEE
ncbi:hypothetical protein [Bradyrhizobium arachidis]|uniref:hypothetical protein n=1 Tax=Bradyrhizobium arachidis TaxID=858423 RepID=UPI0021621726|nr:hypothetical protein [Bradyrhizobium arachidis]